jgi:hypothetical protein
VATLPTYATVDAVASASDVKATAYLDARLARLLQVASRGIDQAMNRWFYPQAATFTWRRNTRERTLWLPKDLLSATTVTFDGETVTGHVLEPRWTNGEPYRYLDLTDATAGGGEIVSVTGVWGYSNQTVAAGTLASSPDADDTAITVSDGSLVGVGDLLTVDSERMVVTGKAYTTTGTTVSGNPTSAASDVTINVASGAAVKVGETIFVDSERMLVLAVVSNALTVRRAVAGSVLAAHSNGATVYAPRALTVERAATGTTGASHTSSTAIYRNQPPALIEELCIAETQTLLGQEGAGWNMTVGEGDNQQESSGRQVGSIRKQAMSLYRRFHMGAV